MYRRCGKRVLDFALTAAAVAILLPVLAALALLIRFRFGAPVLFRQLRPGENGRPFTIYKFRTMSNARDAGGNLLSDSERLLGLGRFLRASSVDELPELINVIKGEMSLVGPRPLLMEYLERYTPEQMRRHAVKPGITGWAQVNGRNALTWEEKFALDLWYVDHVSLIVDLKILMMTVKKVWAREGISAEGEATMPKFTGTRR